MRKDNTNRKHAALPPPLLDRVGHTKVCLTRGSQWVPLHVSSRAIIGPQGVLIQGSDGGHGTGSSLPSAGCVEVSSGFSGWWAMTELFWNRPVVRMERLAMQPTSTCYCMWGLCGFKVSDLGLWEQGVPSAVISRGMPVHISRGPVHSITPWYSSSVVGA